MEQDLFDWCWMASTFLYWSSVIVIFSLFQRHLDLLVGSFWFLFLQQFNHVCYLCLYFKYIVFVPSILKNFHWRVQVFVLTNVIVWLIWLRLYHFLLLLFFYRFTLIWHLVHFFNSKIVSIFNKSLHLICPWVFHDWFLVYPCSLLNTIEYVMDEIGQNVYWMIKTRTCLMRKATVATICCKQ
jgi:hypothetical protein